MADVKLVPQVPAKTICAICDTRPSACIKPFGDRQSVASRHIHDHDHVKKKISLLIAGTAVSVVVAVDPASPASAPSTAWPPRAKPGSLPLVRLNDVR